MKAISALVVMCLFLSACATTIATNVSHPLSMMPSFEAIASIDVQFFSEIVYANAALTEEAYQSLKEEANSQYRGGAGVIDVAEISISRIAFVSGGANYIASGQVVAPKGSDVAALRGGFEGAIAQILKHVPKAGARIRIDFIGDDMHSIAQNLENVLVSEGYTIVGRDEELEALRQEELNYQMDDFDVSEETAITMGNALGANVSITCRFDGENIQLRAQDLVTRQLLGATSISLRDL